MKRLFLTWAMSLIMTATFAQVVSVDSAAPVDVPEKAAEYPGGISALMNFLQRTLKYPKDTKGRNRKYGQRPAQADGKNRTR